MGSNTFGNLFSITTFGESHGPAIGVVIDGCPAGVPFDEKLLHHELERRRPGYIEGVTKRQEPDLPEVLSGVYEGKTLGTPIAIMVRNVDARSKDYEKLSFRPGHADDLWKKKFGHSDYRGGGRASGRETVARVMAGAVAKMLIRYLDEHIQIKTRIKQIGLFIIDEKQIFTEILKEAQDKGESYGALVSINIAGVGPGLGQPIFRKLKSDLASALMSIGGTCGIEFGAGFAAGTYKGSDFHSKKINYGGIRGGMSTGELMAINIVFKPTSSINEVAKKGRHDPCIAIRALPVIEAMCHLVLAEHLLWNRLNQIDQHLK